MKTQAFQRIIVSLFIVACAYVACWEATKRIGIRQVSDYAFEKSLRKGSFACSISIVSPYPFVVERLGFDAFNPDVDSAPKTVTYVWLFGVVLELGR